MHCWLPSVLRREGPEGLSHGAQCAAAAGAATGIQRRRRLIKPLIVRIPLRPPQAFQLYRKEHQGDEDVKQAVPQGVRGKEWVRRRDLELAARWRALSRKERERYKVGRQLGWLDVKLGLCTMRWSGTYC